MNALLHTFDRGCGTAVEGDDSSCKTRGFMENFRDKFPDTTGQRAVR